MNVKSVEMKENSTAELIIEVGAAEFDAAVEAAYKKQRKNIYVPGFRKGKAPRKIIEGMYGAEVFYQEAIDGSFQAAYVAAIDEKELDVVAPPAVEMVGEVSKDGYTFKATVAVRPEAKLGEYKGLTAEKDAVTVSDEEIEAEIKKLVDQATRTVTVDRPAELGDVATIDFEGFKDGVAFEGGKGENYALGLGSHSFIPGFEEQVVGMSAGEEKDLDVTFPADYGVEELNGAAVVFKVKVLKVEAKEIPAVDDEFVKDVSEFDTVDELKQDISKKIEEGKTEQAERKFQNDIMKKLADGLEVELPEAMIDFEVENRINDFRQRLAYQGISFEDYMKYTGATLEKIKEDGREPAILKIRENLALRAIVAAENIEVSEDEVNEAVKKMAEQYGMTEKKVLEQIDLDEFKASLAWDKAAKLVFDNAKVGE